MVKSRPRVILSAAMSLDGKIASKKGYSELSSKQDKVRIHKLRSNVDAILVGSNTVRRDNPSLTVRYVKGKNPIRIVLSILSAVVGMAGGIVLLSVMLLFLPPLVAIPLHGVIQLVSNGSRAWIQRRHVEKTILGYYAVLLLPLAFAGLAIARSLEPPVARALIGAFVLVATHAPGWLLIGSHPEASDPRRRFLMLGGVVGLLSTTIGATGPLIAPFFLNLGLTRQSLIGTKAASQMLGHLAKIAVFGVAGFAFAEYALPLLLLSAMVVVGTWLGSRLLDRVSERVFTLLYKTVLTLIAVRLVAWDGLAALGLR